MRALAGSPLADRAFVAQPRLLLGVLSHHRKHHSLLQEDEDALHAAERRLQPDELLRSERQRGGGADGGEAEEAAAEDGEAGGVGERGVKVVAEAAVQRVCSKMKFAQVRGVNGLSF